MSQTFRQPEILEIARAEGKVMVEDLALRFGVTVQTIRRDLTELANAGKLERVHGGAILPSGVTNILYEERRRLNEAAKTAIGGACAAAIPEDCSIFLDIGTTTEAVARALIDHRNLMVVTNNMNVARILLANADCEIVLAGGALRRSDNGLVGHLTARAIENFKFDHAILGCSALDEDGDDARFRHPGSAGRPDPPEALARGDAGGRSLETETQRAGAHRLAARCGPRLYRRAPA